MAQEERSSSTSLEKIAKLKNVKVLPSTSSVNSIDFSKGDFKREANKLEYFDVLQNGQVVMKVKETIDNGFKPCLYDCATINYISKLEDGTIVETKLDHKIHIGDYEIVPGLDKAILYMRVGEKAEVRISLEYAYGEKDLQQLLGKSKSFPDDTIVIFLVELITVRTEKIEEIESYELRKMYANNKRELGNYYYNRKFFKIAIKIYKRAIQFLNVSSVFLEYSYLQLQDLLKDRLVLFNCLAIAQIKIGLTKDAWESVEYVLLYHKTNSKALYIKAWLLNEQGESEECDNLLSMSYKFFEGDEEEEKHEDELNMYKEVIQECRESDECQSAPPKNELPTFMVDCLIVGVTSIVLCSAKIRNIMWNYVKEKVIPSLVRPLIRNN